MKTAEEIIIEKVGEFWWICGKHRPEFIEAMNEYAAQERDSSNAINNELNKAPVMPSVCEICGKPSHEGYELCFYHLVNNTPRPKHTEA